MIDSFLKAVCFDLSLSLSVPLNCGVSAAKIYRWVSNFLICYMHLDAKLSFSKNSLLYLDPDNFEFFLCTVSCIILTVTLQLFSSLNPLFACF